MTDQPLNSSDQSKILIFFLILAPAVAFLVGAIPALFLGFGIFMMKKNQDFSHVETAVRNFRGYTLLILTVCLISVAYFASTINAENSWDSLNDELMVFLVWSAICVAYLIFLNTLFYKPLKNHKNWIEVNGIFSSKPKEDVPPKTKLTRDMFRTKIFKPQLIADELIKLAKLKEDGHISEDEYNEQKAKLLNKN